MSGVWPFEVTVEDTDFVQNQATFAQHDMYGWYEYEGAQPWAGRSSYVLRSSHYEGGFELEGLVAMCPSTIIDLNIKDSPNSAMDVTYDSYTFVDHGTIVWGSAVIVEIWPPQSDQSSAGFIGSATIRHATHPPLGFLVTFWVVKHSRINAFLYTCRSRVLIIHYMTCM